MDPAQRLGQTAAMGVIVSTGAAGLAPVWVVAVLAVASVGWLEWRKAHSVDVPSRDGGVQLGLVLGMAAPDTAVR